jgi:glycosyltransferase involved in cell wall biosynthesis
MASIAFLVERPTQFEAPFFRYVARGAGSTTEARLSVFFVRPQATALADDPELGRSIDWGIDLLGGYPWSAPASPNDDFETWFAAQLGQNRPDLLIVNGYHLPQYRRAAAVAARLGVPCALRIDSTGFGDSRLRRVAKRALFTVYLKPRFGKFLAVGTLTERYLASYGLPPERIGRFPYSIDDHSFRAAADAARPASNDWRRRRGIPAGVRVILCVSKLAPRETPWDLARIPAPTPAPGLESVWIAIAGDGPDRPAFEPALRERWSGRVSMLGYVPYPQLPATYAGADLFLHAPREERWGVSVAEAMACGLPVITADSVGAAVDLIASGRNGFVYPWGQPKELATALGAALALDPGAVATASREILARWDYKTTWRGLLLAASELAAA